MFIRDLLAVGTEDGGISIFSVDQSTHTLELVGDLEIQ